jgi:transposase
MWWWMREVWNLPVTKAGLTQGLDSLAEHLKPIYNGMIMEVRESPYNQVDETGCRIDGVNWWTWVFHTPKQTVYWTDHSRGSQVPETILGEHYSGAIVSDDYVAYSPLKYTKQACWAHLIRKIRDYAEMKKAHPEQKRLYHRLQGIYHDLKEYLKTPPPPPQRKPHYRRFEQRLKRVTKQKWETKEAQKVAERIKRRLPEYLTCVIHPHIPPQNNAAEQALRPRVIHRKNSTTRSPQSAQTHDILNSLLTTQLQTTPNPLEATHQILNQTTEN